MSAPAAPAQYKVDVQKAVGYQPAPQKVVYTSRDLMLYALSIGVKQDELKFLYENDPQFAAFPTYPLVLGLKKDTHGVSVYGGGGKEDVPGIPAFDPNKLVHGDQSIEIFRPLPLGGEFELHTTVSGVYDKGKGMVIERTTKMVDPKEPNKPYSSMKGSAFVRGYGGWGGPKGPKQDAYEPPKDKAPDAEYEDKTNDDLAILYRLSGDYNPLHIDPKIAPRVGFKKPILHGLCSYGHAAHAVVKTLGNSDANALKSITGRFTAPVYPGDTLVTKMWKVPAEGKDQEKVIFQVVAKERNQIVINGGCAVLWANNKAPQSKL
ncbi:HotDog domain-containing protein [Linnemannia elongata]|nr:HotDog domain-containing protein [Linnemannia elongata]